MLHPGLYEQVINHQISSELAEIPEVRNVHHVHVWMVGGNPGSP